MARAKDELRRVRPWVAPRLDGCPEEHWDELKAVLDAIAQAQRAADILAGRYRPDLVLKAKEVALALADVGLPFGRTISRLGAASSQVLGYREEHIDRASARRGKGSAATKAANNAEVERVVREKLLAGWSVPRTHRHAMKFASDKPVSATTIRRRMRELKSQGLLPRTRGAVK